MASNNVSGCFHCGEAIPPDSQFSVTLNGEQKNMCCPGCEAVAQTIIDSGLASYYHHRTEQAQKVDGLVPAELSALNLYDLEEIQNDFVQHNKALQEVMVSIDGITCAACAWLIERQLRVLPGLAFINVNTTLHRAIIRWDPELIKLSDILKAIAQVGYRALPFQADEQEKQYREQVRSYMKRVGLAGIATMQVMMFAVALYADLFTGMEEEFRQYFRWVSMILATPVLLYSAQPFYFNALRNIRNRTLGMDIPVSIALLGAYIASTYATITGTGEVFFESISMFTFFLLIGRMLELRARRKASESGNNLAKLMPKMAWLKQGDTVEHIPAKLLREGQSVLVKPGETIPADGVIVSGKSSIEESMLTGEHMPVFKTLDEPVYAGTINLESPITVLVKQIGQATLIADIIRMQDLAQAEKPHIQVVADHVSRYFVGALLVFSALTYSAWLYVAPEHAFWVTLSVLVATCPCALSLATPTALTCATATLNKLGILIRKNHVLETLAKANLFVFDKTGTLTQGKFSVAKTHVFANIDKAQSLALAAALEQHSEHPISRAFASYKQANIKIDNVTNVPGEGLEGKLKGQCIRLGKPEFCQVSLPVASDLLLIVMTIDNALVAAFELTDELRDDAKSTFAHFNQQDLNTAMLTGDGSAQANIVATQLGIKTVISGVTPEQKRAAVQQFQHDGHITLMVGDGINDAPVLSQAHVSVAIGSGTDVAKNSADVILIGDSLHKLAKARHLAKQTRDIIRQNLAISLGYNLFILPLAATGHVPPYMAALGMSLSSVVVVTNSLRLLKK
ncbi:heavy metal translocating P-type ATPase [Motilimonas eburnea]|uniref:heavy metal translocating P-type ATPase n=1 Tax=Motilimonas eburnea TaxID=1737488 RepID=UPI001E38C264|nr:heavy metal translocating P-type ATPase [Motilimonas eburnea]MCE2570402.1 cadmium-translocating P-type ATPase [Motilimonas eburnea]